MGLKKRWSKKGQITIFLIIAVVIISAGVVIYNFYPKIKASLSTEQKTPQAFIQDCIEGKIKETAIKLGLQGGSINPKNFVLHNTSKVEFLCYNNELGGKCVVQQPMLISHMEDEMKDELKDGVALCFSSLGDSYRKKGYEVKVDDGEINFELQSKKIVSQFNYSVSMTKGEAQKYDDFIVVLDNNLYELAMIAGSIIEWESTYGEAAPEIYMMYYHNLIVEKQAAGNNGAVVYVITDTNTKNKLQFAVRSGVSAAGIAIPSV